MTPRSGLARLTALLAAAALLSVLLVVTALLPAPPATASAPRPGPVAHGSAIAGQSGRTLVLYDTGGPWGWLGEVYATQTANLVSRFGSWTAHPVTSYAAGEMSSYTAVVYIGSTYGEPLPEPFLDDVLAGAAPTLWLHDNLWQLTARADDFTGRHGFAWRGYGSVPVTEVRYKGAPLTRDPAAGGVAEIAVTDPARAVVLADAVPPGGAPQPWAVRSGRLTYVGEIPYAYTGHDDRYLAYADLLFDLLAPTTPERHRALVRIEDVGPDADPKQLRAIADYLWSQRVPFSVAVYPVYRDPLGTRTGGRPVTLRLRDRPKVVKALKHMIGRGGTLLMHGYTHQYGAVANPYDGVSGNDFEFYTAHVDGDDYVRYDGPVPEDSPEWASSRIRASYREFGAAGLPLPRVFEFPHYAGSAVDYRVVRELVGPRYDRGLYFPGVLTGRPADHSRLAGQFFPYAVRDVYGSPVVPENLGNLEPEAFNHHPARLPADILATGRRNLVVRDGVASFFYHPFLGVGPLREIVTGLRGMGYTFVPAASTLSG